MKNQDNVLEICAGTGLHTLVLIQTGAKVIASDLSPSSLEIIKKRFGDKVVTAADMEVLPFFDASFDVVACAGGFSYGEPALVDAEIRRVLKKGGSFICVDSPKS